MTFQCKPIEVNETQIRSTISVTTVQRHTRCAPKFSTGRLSLQIDFIPPNPPSIQPKLGSGGMLPPRPKLFTVRPEDIQKITRSHEPEFFSRSFWEAPIASVDDERRRQTASTIRRRLDTIVGDETTVEILLALASGELTQSEVARAEGVTPSTVNRRKKKWHQYILSRWVAESN